MKANLESLAFARFAELAVNSETPTLAMLAPLGAHGSDPRHRGVQGPRKPLQSTLAQSAVALQMRPRSQSARNKGDQITAGGEATRHPR